MKHTSIKLDTPCEFINITPLNPLISKCEIKVCYVGEDPNRNRSVITKEVATTLANSLPGSPIVGYFNEASGDFEEHNRIIDISNGKFEIKDTTRPYGFVDLGAKVWFQKFLDDGETEHEYLMTEGYLWTGQYPETERVINQGNNQSMELSDKFLDATWTKDGNGKPKFFIINEAIISKLCILGEECEPCFEGSTITQPTIQFSFDEGFKEQLFSMMTELKELIKEGGTSVFTTFAVEIGDNLWRAIYDFIEANFPDEDCKDYRCSIYCIDGIYEEGAQKFAILRSRKDNKYFRLNFAYTEQGFSSDANLVEVEKTYVPVNAPQFSLEDIEGFEAERYKKSEDKTDKPEDKKTEDKTDDEDKNDEGSTEPDDDKKKKKTAFKKDEDVCPDCGKPLTECACEKKKKDYNLEEIPEYVELQTSFSELETKFAALQQEKEVLEAQVVPLTQFKESVELKDKQAMIDKFYMLSDEDKQDVITNIKNYSVDDIEAKLSVICVRNKVSFNLDDDTSSKGPVTYSINNGDFSNNDSVPDWIKSLQSVAKNMN